MGGPRRNAGHAPRPGTHRRAQAEAGADEDGDRQQAHGPGRPGSSRRDHGGRIVSRGLGSSRRASPASCCRSRASLRRHRRRRRRTPRGVSVGTARDRARRAAPRPVMSDGSPRERPAAGEHLVEDAAEGPDVAAGIDRCPRDLLRAHVGGGAEQRAGRVVGSWRRGVGLSSGGTARGFAMPKSRTFTRPDSPSLMLAGLRSRWTMPFRAPPAARPRSARPRPALPPGQGGPRRSRSARVSPSTSSRTR